MPRPPRIQVAGGVYHVTMRGNNRARVVFDDDDRNVFIATLASARRRYGWRVHSYCLMDNHYHLLLETPEANIAAGMHWLNSTYAHRFNTAHERVGHAFQRRYGANLIADDDDHLLEVIRYLPLNPVRAGLSSRAEDWRWSSYSALLGMVSAPAFLSVDWTLRRFAEDVSDARRLLREWVEAAPVRDPAANPPPLAVILPPGRTATPEALRKASSMFGYSVADIARHLRMHPSNVARRMRTAA
jgi:REP-associated tyrosine transposase